MYQSLLSLKIIPTLPLKKTVIKESINNLTLDYIVGKYETPIS
jgi:hypothetical protein